MALERTTKQIQILKKNKPKLSLSTAVTEFLLVTRFAIVGGMATIIHMSVAASLLHFQLTEVFVANLIAICVAFSFAFTGHYLWTFRIKRHWIVPAIRYCAISVGAFAISNAILFALVSYSDLGNIISVIVSSAFVPVISYILSRFWGFRDDPEL